MAVESGSRLWGFPSADSDYDVRFIYVRRVKDYLSIHPYRDVIECPINHDPFLNTDLDMNGWDIKKAIELAGKSNRAFVEWVQSPIIYYASPVYDPICKYVTGTVDLAAMFQHYVGWARKLWNDEQSTTDRTAKSYCYALRAALSAAYIVHHRSVPPPDVQSLIRSHPNASILQAPLDQLLERKKIGPEYLKIKRIAVFDEAIEMSLNMSVPAIPASVISKKVQDDLFHMAINYEVEN